MSCSDGMRLLVVGQGAVGAAPTTETGKVSILPPTSIGPDPDP